MSISEGDMLVFKKKVVPSDIKEVGSAENLREQRKLKIYTYFS